MIDLRQFILVTTIDSIKRAELLFDSQISFTNKDNGKLKLSIEKKGHCMGFAFRSFVVDEYLLFENGYLVKSGL